MATPDELRIEIASARAAFREALASANEDGWETVSGGDWTPRQVAQHAIPAQVYFASEICAACGYPGLERPAAEYPTAAAALAAFDEAADKADGRLKYVSEADLLVKHERMGSVESIMQLDASHLIEHASQMSGS